MASRRYPVRQLRRGRRQGSSSGRHIRFDADRSHTVFAGSLPAPQSTPMRRQHETDAISHIKKFNRCAMRLFIIYSFRFIVLNGKNQRKNAEIRNPVFPRVRDYLNFFEKAVYYNRFAMSERSERNRANAVSDKKYGLAVFSNPLTSLLQPVLRVSGLPAMFPMPYPFLSAFPADHPPLRFPPAIRLELIIQSPFLTPTCDFPQSAT